MALAPVSGRGATCSFGSVALGRRYRMYPELVYEPRDLIMTSVVCQRPTDTVPSATRVAMCRNIKTLHNFNPPATEEEILASSLQFVRKLSGFTRPSKANQPGFDRAVDQVATAAQELLQSLVSSAPPRDREVEAARAKARAANRFTSSASGRATY